MALSTTWAPTRGPMHTHVAAPNRRALLGSSRAWTLPPARAAPLRFPAAPRPSCVALPTRKQWRKDPGGSLVEAARRVAALVKKVSKEATSAQSKVATVDDMAEMMDFEVSKARPQNYWRSAVHAGNGVVTIAACHLILTTYKLRLAVMSVVFVGTWGWEVGRRLSPTFAGVAKQVFQAVGLASCFHEEEWTKVTSWTWYVTSLFLLAAFVPFPAAIAAIAVLGVGDPAAGIVGRAIGNTKIVGQKSLEGSLAFLAAGYAGAYLGLAIACGPGGGGGSSAAVGATGRAAVAGAAAVAGCLGELFNGPVDDNLAVPVAAGAAGALAMAALGL